MSIRLIVNADDFGRTGGVSAGIREAHLHGLVTSTTALMNMPGIDEALRLAMKECPRLGLGVHLVLTSGSPLLPVKEVPSLTSGEARFPNLDDQTARLSKLHLNEVRAEWRSQIERFIAITKRPPDHLDSHHHFSYFTEGLFRVMLELAKDYHCAIRLLRPGKDGKLTGLPSALVPQIEKFIPRLVDELSPRCPDFFEARFYDRGANTTTLRTIIAGLSEGTTELVCHPGYADPALLVGSSYNRQRETEVAVLTDASVLSEVEKKGVQRITFAEL
jgi:predicted glycoside hydrolase/deacetylase ChbG (UPF0249 family)